ncbi:MAG: DUF4300 family protein [Anaerolineae bacterium]
MKRAILLMVVAASILLMACRVDQTPPPTPTAQGPQPTVTPASPAFLISNLADEESRQEVASILKQYLPEANVDQFVAAVVDYNQIIQQTSLNQGFEDTMPNYDMGAISSLWEEKRGELIGTNCRINAFLLLKGALKIGPGETDDSLLFIDKDAISAGNLFSAEETAQFMRLYSRVQTESTEDVAVHAEKMRQHLEQFTFDEHARMISLVLHDTLAGDYLFIGHVGVLVEHQGEYLYVEKLSFEEPYQAIKFQREEDCYQYLLKKFEGYADEGAAKPFIMVNSEFKASGS